MEEVNIIQKDDAHKNKTINLKSILHSKVLSVESIIVGKVKEVRINPKTMGLEAITISRGSFRPPLYVGKSYFQKVSDDAVILNIDPFILIKKLKVISMDGKKVGRVIEIIRSDYTNDIKSIIAKSLFKRFNIPAESIKLIGKSVILKINYDGTKKYIEQRS